MVKPHVIDTVRTGQWIECDCAIFHTLSVPSISSLPLPSGSSPFALTRPPPVPTPLFFLPLPTSIISETFWSLRTRHQTLYTCSSGAL